MAIAGSGLYLLSLEKQMMDTLGVDMEIETNKVGLVLDGYTPNYLTHAFHSDLTNEHVGGNYVKELLITTELTVAGEVLTYDAADTVFDNGGADDVTITDAMAAVVWTEIGTSGTDQLIGLWDFVTTAASTNSTFTVQWNGSGLWTLDAVV